MALGTEELEQIKGMLTEAIRPIGDKLKEVELTVTGLKDSVGGIRLSEVPEEELQEAGVKEDDDEKAKMSKVVAYRARMNEPVRKRDLLSFISELGGNPAKGSKGEEGKEGSDGKTAFTKKVEEIMAASNVSRGVATQLAVKNFAPLYREHMTKKFGGKAAAAA